MTESERDQAITSIQVEQARVDEYNKKAADLAEWQKFVGNVAYVNLITVSGESRQITDPDMLTKANNAVDQIITATQAEIDSI
jgi:hypothetical protein